MSLSQGLLEGGVGSSARLEQKDGDLTKVEVDEVLGLMRHVRTEVTADDCVPGGVVLFVEFLLDERGNVLLNVVALESLGADVDSVLLHVLGHVSVLDDCLSVCHLLVVWGGLMIYWKFQLSNYKLKRPLPFYTHSRGFGVLGFWGFG